jgi:hypothetical protein
MGMGNYLLAIMPIPPQFYDQRRGLHPIVSNKARIAEAIAFAFAAAVAVFVATFVTSSAQLMDKTTITHLFRSDPGTVCSMISTSSSTGPSLVLNTLNSEAAFTDSSGDLDRFEISVGGKEPSNNNGKGGVALEFTDQYFANRAACVRELSETPNPICAKLAGTLATAPVAMTGSHTGVSHCVAAKPATGFRFSYGQAMDGTAGWPAQNVPAGFNCRARFQALFCDSGVFAARAPAAVCDKHVVDRAPFSCTSRVPKLTTSESLALAFSNANAAWIAVLSAAVFFMHHCCRMMHNDDTPTPASAARNKDEVVPFDDGHESIA